MEIKQRIIEIRMCFEEQFVKGKYNNYSIYHINLLLDYLFLNY